MSTVCTNRMATHACLKESGPQSKMQRALRKWTSEFIQIVSILDRSGCSCPCVPRVSCVCAGCLLVVCCVLLNVFCRAQALKRTALDSAAVQMAPPSAGLELTGAGEVAANVIASASDATDTSQVQVMPEGLAPDVEVDLPGR